MNEKILGKIAHVDVGMCGYQEKELGLRLSFSLNGGSEGAATSIGTRLDITALSNVHAGEVLHRIGTILQQAKVTDVAQLQGIPIEATFENGVLLDWRILTEVL